MSRRHSRRAFLRGAGAAAVGAAVGPRNAFGAGPPSPPTSQSATRVLEIFMVSGASHRETTWIETPDGYGQNAWRDVELNWATDIGAQGLYAPADGSSDLYEVVPNRFMSSAALPLQNTPLWERLNLVAMRHDLGPHEPAQALTLTGNTLGRPRFAGMGAMMQRAFGTPGGPPVSWVLDTGINTIAANYAAATGLIGAQHRPPIVPVGPGGIQFLNMLQRAGVSADQDPLLAHYNNRYATRLQFQGSGTTARSSSYESYAGSVQQLLNAQDIHGALDSASGGSLWVPNNGNPNNCPTRKAIDVACGLLNSGSHYVCVLDRGLSERDSHEVGAFATNPPDPSADEALIDQHSQIHNGDLWSIFNALRHAYDSGALNPYNTLILIHSEFGRGWVGQVVGTEHWPHGYPAILIGGGFTGRTLYGDIDTTQSHGHGEAIGGFGNYGGFSPTDLRVLALMMADVDPFDTGDLFLPEETTAGSNAGAVINAFNTMFGL